MSSKRTSAAASAAPARPANRRARHDGWTPDRQQAFIEALAQSACVTEACRTVGLSKQSAYALRMQPAAQGFRIAWDAALDLGIRRLTDECLSRALHGVPVPHFYQGQQVGEHRRYDNRLAMFLLRYRQPLTYAATLDQMVYSGHPETAAVAFARACHRMMDEAHGVAEGPADLDHPLYETATIAEATAVEASNAAADRAAQTAYELDVGAEMRRFFNGCGIPC